MADIPKKIRSLIDTLKQEYLVSGLQKRKSPLGVDEYILPSGLADSLLGAGTAAATGSKFWNNEPYIMYNRMFANDPSTQTHERIHAGQRLLPNDPNLMQVINSLPVYPEDIRDYRNPEREYPAHRFDTYYGDVPEQQAEFNRYIDMMRSINPSGVQPLEAAMPQELIREYVKSHARPLYPPKIIK